MKEMEEFIKVAVIGTASYSLGKNLSLPKSINELIGSIRAKSNDEENVFLSSASVVMSYKKAGRLLPILREEIKQSEKETKKICPLDFSKALQSILNNHWDSLLELWLDRCNSFDMVVSPEFLPELLELGKTNPKLHDRLQKVIGNRGQWLASFNEQWSYVFPIQDESLWEIGKLEERKMLLRYVRKNDSKKARELLEKTWSEEDLNTKITFLPYLSENLSLEDEPFLEKVLKEKSNKTWEVAFNLLKSLPDSKLVNRSWEILSSIIRVAQKKSILQSSKIQIEFNLPDSFDKEIKELNFRIGNRKGYTKEENFLFELIALIPPSKWKSVYNITAEKLLPEIQKSKNNKKYLEAFMEATILHQDKDWAEYIISCQKSSEYYRAKLFNSIPFDRRENYILDILRKEKIGTYDTWFFSILEEYSDLWSLEFSLEIFYFLAMLNKMPEKKYLQGIAVCIHKGMAEEIKDKKYFNQLSKQDQNSIEQNKFFEEMSYEMERIIRIREKIVHNIGC
ncbi:MAG: hypothetical protein H7A23_04435 [Leptospiraceae bacterium]|nr:hypothetical protein [Leptospiraceae bacterium]